MNQKIYGTSMMMGIGTANARLNAHDYRNMLGENKQSWGLSHEGLLWHNRKPKQYTEAFKDATIIGLYFDGSTLTYYKDGVSLGVAFTGLEDIKEPLFPIICSTASDTIMELGIRRRNFTTLLDQCRDIIQARIEHKENINKLMLPRTLKHYISVNFPAPLYDIDDDTTSRYPVFYFNLWLRNQFDVFFNNREGYLFDRGGVITLSEEPDN